MVLLAHADNVMAKEKVAVASDASRYVNLIHEEIDARLKDMQNIQIRSLDYEFVKLEDELDKAKNVKAGWDSYSAPVPHSTTIDLARIVLRELHSQLIKPSWVSPSAEGGIALSFLTSSDRRAIIEILNNGEKFLLLYDLHGNSETHEWPENFTESPFETLISPLKSYLWA